MRHLGTHVDARSQQETFFVPVSHANLFAGGGLPVGAYGGRRDIMEMVAPAGPMYQVCSLLAYLSAALSPADSDLDIRCILSALL